MVDIAGSGAPAVVTEHAVGSYRWLTREEFLADATELEDLESRLRSLPDLSSTILRLFLKGTLALAGRAESIVDCSGLAAAMFHLDVDDLRNLRSSHPGRSRVRLISAACCATRPIG